MEHMSTLWWRNAEFLILQLVLYVVTTLFLRFKRGMILV
jgi:hypothetical protein